MARTTERIEFEGAFGDRLAARLERPRGEARAWALFAHCFTCGKDLKAAVRISRALAEAGIGVLRFDFTGLGESAGDFAETNFSSNVADLVAAAVHLRREERAPQLLVGHSLGGAAVIRAAGRIPEVEAVATVGAPSDTEHLRDTLLSAAPELADAEEAEVSLAGRRFRIRRQLLEDLAEQSMGEALADLGRPLMIFHSPIDGVVGIDHAKRLYQAARHPKSFVSLDGADHLLLEREEDARFVGSVLASWAGRYLTLASEAEEAGGEEAEHGVVVVRGGAEGFRQRVAAGRHELVADEPESVGGTDEGPNPYGLLLAALGTCKSMTMRMYADRKEWPLDGVEVRLEHSRIHAEDCEECETERGKIDRIEIEIGVSGDLDEEQRRRLLEIADRCPVHRTITSEIDLRTRPAGEER